MVCNLTIIPSIVVMIYINFRPLMNRMTTKWGELKLNSAHPNRHEFHMHVIMGVMMIWYFEHIWHSPYFVPPFCVSEVVAPSREPLIWVMVLPYFWSCPDFVFFLISDLSYFISNLFYFITNLSCHRRCYYFSCCYL